MMIAMALSCGPSLIMADEPTTALDVTIQAQILELIKDLSRRLGVSLVIITHNLGVVARYADRVNVMYAGKMIEQGTAREVYADPRHPYTLGLLRSVPRLDEPRKAKLDPIDGQPPDLTRLPVGCAFAPRCVYKIDRCAREVPSLAPVGAPGHLSACWVADKLEVKEKA
jgi:oligopeptide/dipeptide ABC transporter ATP-binding protein